MVWCLGPRPDTIRRRRSGSGIVLMPRGMRDRRSFCPPIPRWNRGCKALGPTFRKHSRNIARQNRGRGSVGMGLPWKTGALIHRATNRRAERCVRAPGPRRRAQFKVLFEGSLGPRMPQNLHDPSSVLVSEVDEFDSHALRVSLFCSRAFLFSGPGHLAKHFHALAPIRQDKS